VSDNSVVMLRLILFDRWWSWYRKSYESTVRCLHTVPTKLCQQRSHRQGQYRPLLHSNLIYIYLANKFTDFRFNWLLKNTGS